ncbi:transposase family protein [Streptomyces sp. NRRL B-24572]|uniref:helix-turn-helix domain-containing protein n=1 Tax=Streptomyces sp. NRRL B-24572 TaxID=1962156 RepID=UPI00211B2703|nr:transposase family protein [Streptomyces sp. NRRL B-24572]
MTVLGPLWHERRQDRLASRPRKRAVGAGAKHRLVFVNRLLATLVHLRHGVTHDVPACWFGVDRSTTTRAIGEVRPLLAERGCTISPDVRLRTLADVVDHLGATGKSGIIDGTEIRGRRPAAGPGSFCLRQEQAERRQIHGGHGRRKPRPVVQPGRSGKLRGHHPRPSMRTDRTPDRRSSSRDPRRRRLSKTRSTDRRTRRDATPSQVQEECPGPVRGDVRAAAQGTLFAPYPGRARHRTPERTGGPWPGASAAANT